MGSEGKLYASWFRKGFLSDWAVKNPPATQETQETWVQSLGWEDPLKEEMATHSSVLAWKNLKDRGIWQAMVYRIQKVRHDWMTEHII